jgi:uncharacterized lipoprotein YbaY
MAQRRIQGQLLLPADAAGAARIRIELRDVSKQDMASVLLAARDLDGITLTPGAPIGFHLDAPEGSGSLQIRVQADAVSPSGAPAVYLTTQAYPVAPTGDVQGLEVALKKA